MDDDPKDIEIEQKVQRDEQQAQAIRQTKQGLRQDEQGIRQDSGQEQQNITDKITTAHTEKLLEVEQRQNKAEQNLDQIIEGVDLLTVQARMLNERVYTKNYLDRVRNFLIGGLIFTFVVVSLILGFLLFSINESDHRRENEATQGRRQIADCTVKPGVELEKGYINPGECYKESNARTGAAINQLTKDIVEQIRLLLEK